MSVTRAPLPIKGGAYTNIDEIGVGPYAPELVNGYVDEAGNTHKWPGLSELCDVGTQQPVDRLYWWARQNILIIFSNGQIFKKTTSTAQDDQTEITGTSTGIQAGNRVYVADFGTALYAANGGKIVKIPSSGNAEDLTDGDAPTAVTRVDTIDTYLLAVDSAGITWFSEVGDPESWVGEYFVPVVKPDITTGMIVAFQEVYLIGEESLEVWRDDGVTPFIPNQNAYVQSGTIAPDSFIIINSRLHFLDNRRHFVAIESRLPQSKSVSMNKYIQDLSAVSDCTVDEVTIDGRLFLILTFPQAEKTLAYNVSQDDPNAWCRLTEWDSGSAAEGRYRLNTAAYCPNWNLMLVGDYRNGKVYMLDHSYDNNAGDTLRMVRRTSHVDHGLSNRKRSYGLHLRLKRKNVASDPPNILVRFRDDGGTDWSNEISIPAGNIGDTSYLARLDGALGIYVTRQWEFVFSDDCPIVLVGADELVEASNA